MLEWTSPLMLVGLLALPILGWYFWRGLTDFAVWQRLVSLGLRTVIVVLLVMALAGLTLLRPTQEQFVVFAVDESLSVSEESKREAEAFLAAAERAAGRNRIAFLRFGAQPGPVVTQREKPVPIDGKGTNIEAALEVATAAIPPTYVPHIVLISDGNQTHGDALRAALRGRVPVSTLPMMTRTEPEVQVSAVNAPPQVREGEPFNLEVVIDANHDDEGEVEVFRGAHKVASQRVKVQKGENRLQMRQTLIGEKMGMFTARIKGFSDRLQDNNSASALVAGSGKPRVLIIDSDVRQARQHLASALEQEGVLVHVRPATGMPDSLADLQNYEALIISNVPATALTQRQMEVARTYVQDLGGGLIMIGGDQSFGLGGYYKSVIEEILPVRSDFEKEKEKPSLAMVLVIDKSGSMGGEKMELAKDAAKAAVELLGPKDKVGVIAFEGDFFWVADIQPCTAKGPILEKISAIEAGGGTVMGPPMEAAYEALLNTQAKLKHVIVLTDGVSSPADFDGIAQNMANAKITCSTVGVGDDLDRPLLERIAQIGKGRFYYAEDPQSVPQIFAKETVTASKAALNEQPFVPAVMRPTQVLAGIDLANAPFLLGYVTTRPKPTSEPILVSEKGDPVLAWWRYGLGMSAAFTSDAKGRWAAEWVGWPGFSKFWVQVVRHIMRKSDAQGVFVDVRKQGDQVQVMLDAVNPGGRFLNQAATELTVIDPNLGDRKLTMSQIAPGRYTATFSAPGGERDQPFHLQLTQKTAAGTTHLTRGLVVGYSDEFRLRPTNETLLRQLAKETGGRYSPTPQEVFAPPTSEAWRVVEIWPWLILAAVLIFVVDVAFRRIDFTLWFGGYR